MNRSFVRGLVLFICGVSILPHAIPALAQQAPGVTHVATALNHLSVLEFQEPVTLAAAGSSDFQVERQENKVFIKPMKAGASTDLFVWTASRRFAYELETTPEVKNMNFAIDNPAPTPPTPPAAVSTRADEFADMMLTRAFLGTVEISNAQVHLRKNQVNVRVEEVFRTRSTIYVHYTLINSSERQFHLQAPTALELQPGRSSVSLPSLAHKQLDDRMLRNLRNVQTVALPIGHAASASEDLGPGETTEGVVAIRLDLNSPAVVQLVFDDQVRATFVL
jgi:hypothetical protein